MSARARAFVVPLVVLSVVLVALVVAIVVVLLVRANSPTAGRLASGRPPTGASTAGAVPAGGFPASGSVAIDPCVVGTWRITAHREEVALNNLGTVTFTGAGDGATVRLDASGAGVTDYGTDTRFQGTASGRAIRLDVRGTVSYHYAASGGTVSYRDPRSEATVTVVVDGTRSTEAPFTANTGPARYECSADRMIQRTNLFQTTYARVKA